MWNANIDLRQYASICLQTSRSKCPLEECIGRRATTVRGGTWAGPSRDSSGQESQTRATAVLPLDPTGTERKARDLPVKAGGFAVWVLLAFLIGSCITSWLPWESHCLNCRPLRYLVGAGYAAGNVITEQVMRLLFGARNAKLETMNRILTDAARKRTERIEELEAQVAQLERQVAH